MRVGPPAHGQIDDSPRSAGELFTDRQSESQAFKQTLRAFRRLLDADADAGTVRHNVISFYGLGGIGKSALSVRLERWAKRLLPLDNGWGSPPETPVDATARLDLHASTGQVDLLQMLLALRTGAGSVRRRWPVFDLAFAAYWTAVRPGESLPKFSGNSDLDALVVETIGDAVGDLASIADLATGTPIGLGVRGVRALVTRIRRRQDLNLGLEATPDFAQFLLRCADEPSALDARPDLACQIAELLAWELARITPNPLIVIFIDTFERLTTDPRRIAEGHLNQFIHALPNVLFVVTGRDLIDWADPARVDLRWRGNNSWPGLSLDATADPRQHLVGRLSPHDTRSVIERARSLYELPIDDEVVEELVLASAGLPQYLDLARQAALNVLESEPGRRVRVADVTGTLGALVKRVLDDVPPDEQRAIRAAALFRTFDVGLAAAAADVDFGTAERAVHRPMIDRIEDERLPYRMHDAVREAIRGADHRVPGGWVDRDWHRAGSRAAAAIHVRFEKAKAEGRLGEVLDEIGLAITLACEQDLDLEPSGKVYADWLTKAIVFGPSIAALRTRIPGASQTPYGQSIVDFVAAKSPEVPRPERLRLLRAIFDSDHPLKLPAGRHLGYTFKSAQRWAEALDVFDEVAAISSADVNLRQRPLTLAVARQFSDAAVAAEGLPIAAGIRRTTAYAHGNPSIYLEEMPPIIEQIKRSGRQREVLEEQSVYLARRVFFVGDVEVEQIDLRLAEAEEAGHTVAVRSLLLAGILAARWSRADIAFALERVHALDRLSAAEGVVAHQWAFAEVVDAVRCNELDRLIGVRDEALTARSRSRAWIPMEAFLAMQGVRLPDEPTQWLEPQALVWQRWANHLNAFLQRQAS